VINCPHCGTPESTVREVKSFPDFNRRYRQCTKCKRTYCTHEVLAVYAGKRAGMVENMAPLLETDE
jgi:transcriptional regulator NrdR family protein